MSDIPEKNTLSLIQLGFVMVAALVGGAVGYGILQAQTSAHGQSIMSLQNQVDKLEVNYYELIRENATMRAKIDYLERANQIKK